MESLQIVVQLVADIASANKSSSLSADVYDGNEIVGLVTGWFTVFFDCTWFAGQELLICKNDSRRLSCVRFSAKCEYCPWHIGGVLSVAADH